jgi:tetratricopeptide (TPR) repeat protein
VSVGNAHFQLAELAIEAHRPAEAVKEGERALNIFLPVYQADNVAVAKVLSVLGVAAEYQGQYDLAIAKQRRAIAVFAAAHSCALANALTYLGRALIKSGARDEARSVLLRAEELRSTIDADPQEKGATAFALAQTLEPKDRERAHQLAQSAFTAFVAGGPRFAIEAVEARNWLRDNLNRNGE